MAIVDVHTHVVPSSLADLPARHRLWPTLEMREAGQAALVIDGKPFREIDARSWDLQWRMRDMAADGTDVQVLSPMPELLSHWLPAELADHLARIMNNQIVEMIDRAPDKFRGIGMVPMQDVELATKRLDDSKRQGLCGVEIGTHIDGVPLGDPKLSKFYARAEELGLLVFVHPLHRSAFWRIGLDRTAWSSAQTTPSSFVSLPRELLRLPRSRTFHSTRTPRFCWGPVRPRSEERDEC